MDELLEFIGKSQVHDLNDLYTSFEQRIRAVEDFIASISQISPSNVKNLIEQVARIEQQSLETSQALASSEAKWDKRISSLELKIADMGNATTSPSKDHRSS